MGRDLDKERFTEAEYTRFGERIREQLGVLRELLDTPVSVRARSRSGPSWSCS
ncbi:hypothetical protein ACFQ0B_31610 [Nonomuraea thailandensis]